MAFSERDNLSSPKVMIVDESSARHFWGSANPIGKRISMDRENAPGKLDTYEVIGLVKDAKYGDLDEKTLKTAYVPFGQDANPRPEINYEIRTDGAPEALTPAVRAKNKATANRPWCHTRTS